MLQVFDFFPTEVCTVAKSLDKEARREFLPRVSRGVCLHCNRKPVKGGEPLKRGLCSACSQALVRLIAKGITTREQEVELGRLLPRAKPGRKPSNACTKKLSGMS